MTEETTATASGADEVVKRPVPDKVRQLCTELLQLMLNNGMTQVSTEAYGSGDEGRFDDVRIEFADGVDECVLDTPTEGDDEEESTLEDDIYQLVEDILEALDYDYYNGNGGELHFHADAATRTCGWDYYVNAAVHQEDGQVTL